MILRARKHWRYRGQTRPSFAEPVPPGKRSVWDFPRPPSLLSVEAELRVRIGDTCVATTRRGVQVCETASAPTYYFPPEDVAEQWLRPDGNESLCEWKGKASGFSVHCPGATVDSAGWRYLQVFEEYADLHGWYAFYPGRVACFVGDERARPQPGGFYGGWVTDELAGPIKGVPGSRSW
jgi:uncharacterized protein (DUF427 family)